jgi:hypothetical protein
MEVSVRVAKPARELGKLVGGKGGEVEKAMRETFENGVSVEAEYAFTKSVSEYCREAVREGTYRGGYKLNLRDQMERRMDAFFKKGGKPAVLMVGGSQMGRMEKEMRKKGREVVEMRGWVEMKGEWNEDEVKRVAEEVGNKGRGVDVVVLGGPGNVIVKHGKREERGFCPERTVNVGRDEEGEMRGVSVKYHLTEPARLTMREREDLVIMAGKLVGEIREAAPDAKIFYLTMFPRHLESCCGAPDHMTDEDVLLVNGFRKAVDGDLVEELEEMERVEVLEWWKLMGWDEEGTVDMMRRKKVVGPDGVHLSVNANRFAAVSLCSRLAEKEVTISGGATKKMRIG